MRGLGCFVAALLLAGLAVAGWLAWGWYGGSEIEEDAVFIVPQGASLTDVAERLEETGHVNAAGFFLARSRIFGSSAPIQAGEFALSAGLSEAGILSALQNGEVVRRFITIPEGMPSVLVHERLMDQPLLTGDVAVPEEGSILPQTYDFERGEARADVLARMQTTMDETLARTWAARSPDTVVNSPEEALILASIVEKETGLARERGMIAGVMSNRLRTGMRLDADATTIYPITRGRPLGRMIRRSELDSLNPYNTRAVAGLPPGPITNPGRESIEAVLDPANTDALFYVADGTGGHIFARTLREHNANVRQWREIRRARGEM